MEDSIGRITLGLHRPAMPAVSLMSYGWIVASFHKPVRSACAAFSAFR